MYEQYDAVIVRASLAGCAAATFLGRRGARLALVEKPDPGGYKRTCTHFILAHATPTLEACCARRPAAVVLEAYVNAVSTRKVDRLAGCGVLERAPYARRRKSRAIEYVGGAQRSATGTDRRPLMVPPGEGSAHCSKTLADS